MTNGMVKIKLKTIIPSDDMTLSLYGNVRLPGIQVSEANTIRDGGYANEAEEVLSAVRHLGISTREVQRWLGRYLLSYHEEDYAAEANIPFCRNWCDTRI